MTDSDHSSSRPAASDGSAPLTDVVLQNRLLMRCRLRQMQVLVAVAQQGSIRRAADVVGMTQPGVTKVLAELESLLGTRLFHRWARGVRPTEAAAELLQFARQTLDGAMVAAAALAARSRQGEGCVRVMGTISAVRAALLQPLVDFHLQHPRVQVQVDDAPRDALLLALARGQVDLALVRALPQVPQGWRSVRLLDDEMVVFAGARHPLARRRQLTLHDLRDQLWLPGHAVAATRTQLDAFAQELGQPLRTCEVLTQLSEATCVFLRRTDAITLAPRGALWHFVQSGELVVLPLDRHMPFSSIGMLLPEGPLPPATQRLADFLLRHHRGDAAGVGVGREAGP